MSAFLRRVRRAGRDQGSISLWLATAGLAMIILVGLAVDLSGQVYAQQHARDVARQAARAAGQQLQGPAAVLGQGVVADPYAAQQAAQTYLDGSGLSGSAQIVNGQTIRVNTTDSYQTKFLGIIGINGFTVHGQADSRITRSVGGVEQ